MANPQSYVKLRRGIRDHLKIMTSSELKVYIDLLTSADFKTGEVQTNVSTICATCDLSSKIVNSALNRLAAMKYITYRPAKNQWQDAKIKILKYSPVELKNASVKSSEPTTEAGTEPTTEAGTKAQIQKQGKQAPKKSKEYIRSQKNKDYILYGDFVKLTENEYQKLIDKLGQSITEQYIERLNLYIGSKGDKYKSHYYTILNWVNKDNKGGDKNGNTGRTHGADIDKYEEIYR